MSGIVPPAAEEFQSTRPCGARQPRLVAQVDESTVSIHAPVRGATGHLGAATVGPPVSIHAPVRGATLAFVGQVAVVVVSIHAPVRGATAVVSACVASAAMFQSTRPCGARRFRPASSRPARQRFNPRARAGRDMMGRSRNSSVAVFQSTRPCGARHSGGETVQRLRGVSIHAPVRGATRSLRRSRARTMFQSTRPCGARRERVVGVGRWLVVSIHAPVRGATLTFREPAVRACCFNPRARAGRDLRLTCAGELQHEFQSTRPCGARLVDPDVAVCAFQFQSTRPCGARLTRQSATRYVRSVSIHAPVRGATQHTFVPGIHQTSFNPRARAGRDFGSPRGSPDAKSFNPRARAGRDGRRSGRHGSDQGFNPRARAGRDVSIISPVCGSCVCFNPRARAGRDSVNRQTSMPGKRFNPRARAGRDRPLITY